MTRFNFAFRKIILVGQMNQGAICGTGKPVKKRFLCLLGRETVKPEYRRNKGGEKKRVIQGFHKMGETVFCEVITFQFHWTEWEACHWSATS